jgi:hypothetical protein
MARRLAGAALVATILATGCGQAPGAFAPQGAAGAFDASARKALGGAAYAAFKIAPELPKADGTRGAVKLTYLMTDDTAHQSPQSLGMLRMMDGLPRRDVHNVVFRDGGEYGDARLYYMQEADKTEGTVRNPQSVLAPGVGEVASNNPKVFSQVLGWTLDRYPGKRKYLQIYTHGGGVFGIGTDEKQTDLQGKPLPKEQQTPIMRLPELSEALRQGLKGRELDVIYFRACLMSNVEALYELRGTTRYAVASEDVSSSVANSNLTMTKLFDDLAAADTEPAELARRLAIQGMGKHQNAGGQYSGYMTIAAIDLSKIDELKTALNGLARALVAGMPKHGEAIRKAYGDVPFFGDSEKYQRDLWAFTAALDKQVADPAVKAAVASVRAAQRAAMLHAKDGYGGAANGMSIFMPPLTGEEAANGRKFLQGRYQETRFAKDAAWDDFLDIVAAGGGNK